MSRLANWLEASPRELDFSPSELAIPEAALARALGYTSPQSWAAPERVATEIVRARDRARKLLTPRAVWTVVPAEPFDDFILCDRPLGTRLGVGVNAVRQLRGCRAVAAYVATIGGALEAEARGRMTDGDALGGFILDTLGSVAADACAAAVRERIQREALGLDWFYTNRCSPGYCSWPAEDLCALLSILPAAPAGVRLATNGLMQPLKSSSGILGLGPDVIYSEYACSCCGRENCQQQICMTNVEG